MKPSQVIPQFLSDSDVQDQSRNLYEFAVMKFIKWVQANGLDLDNLTRADIIRYKSDLQKSNLAISTQKNYITVLRIFYRWAAQNNLHDDITIGIRNPKYDLAYKRYPLTQDQVYQLLDSIDQETERGARDYAMISLMIHNGFRRAEIAGLNIGDVVISGERQGLFIKGKGKLEKQFVKVTDSSMDVINDYLVKRSGFKDEDPLFTATIGYYRGHRMKLVSISKMVKKRLRNIGLDSKYYTCHSLRHTSACLLLGSGFDLHKVQLFMRHKSPNTTQLYTRVLDEMIRLENEAGNTLEKLIINRPENDNQATKHII